MMAEKKEKDKFAHVLVMCEIKDRYTSPEEGSSGVAQAVNKGLLQFCCSQLENMKMTTEHMSDTADQLQKLLDENPDGPAKSSIKIAIATLYKKAEAQEEDKKRHEEQIAL